MSGILNVIIRMSISASFVIVAVLLMRIFMKKIPKIYSYLLWIFVLFRLLCPVTFESSFSLMPRNMDIIDTSDVFNTYPTMPETIGTETNTAPEIMTEAAVDQSYQKVNQNSKAEFTPRSAAAATRISIFDIAVAVWVLGILVLMTRAIYFNLRLKKRLSTATILYDRVYCSDRIMTAYVYGIFHPRIYLPSNTSPDEMEYILLHEKTHISRRDNIIKLAAYGALLLHWFNPLVWTAFYQMEKDMEMSCDESVIRKKGDNSRSNYAYSILSFSAKQSGFIAPLAFGESSVKSRIRNVLNYKRPSFWVVIIAVVAIITAGFCLLPNPSSNETKPGISDQDVTSPPQVDIEDTKVDTAIQKSDIAPVTEQDLEIQAQENFEEAKKAGYIGRKPGATDFSGLNGKISELPMLRSYGGYDVRSTDLSGFDLTNTFDKLIHSTYDSKTIWPKKMPENFNPEKTMELYKNPGLNVRKLHEMGITGEGIGIAIIDQPLLVDHQEYRDRLKYYYEMKNVGDMSATFHGTAVASIAAGNTVGVAPEANLYYVAMNFGDSMNSNIQVANAIHHILDLNDTLPQEEKIRVISISWAYDSQKPVGYDILQEEYNKAKEEGIFVLTNSISIRENMDFSGLDKIPLSDPDDHNNYLPGYGFSSTADYKLNIPMNYRTTASPTGKQDYTVYMEGGLSWTTPYVAGLYALACQVKPDITYEGFWKLAAQTARTSSGTYEGKKYQAEYIIDPVAIIESLHK